MYLSHSPSQKFLSSICMMLFQFTENAVATHAAPCERLRCGKIIKPGEPCIAKEDITNHIKYVCDSCAKYYNEKEAAVKLGSVIHTSITLSQLLITLIILLIKLPGFFSQRCEVLQQIFNHMQCLSLISRLCAKMSMNPKEKVSLPPFILSHYDSDTFLS